MPKILEEKYPKGTLKGQQTAGRYIDGYLYDNLKILAEKIVDDMTFLGIGFSSTLEVGTGKSVFFTQIGECWSYLMKKIHNIDVPFTENNIVWRPIDLIEKSFEVPKYSCILVDEWEDAHYWSELGMTLRNFFRKCRQLNLFILVIIPNYFQMPINYAVGRSIFAIDVKFKGKFERGYFNFYDFESKRELYIKGKKYHNYFVAKPSFIGRFTNGYGVDEKKYLEAKAEDLRKMESGESKEYISPMLIEKRATRNVLKIIFKNKDLFNKDGISTKTLAKAFGVALRSMQRYVSNADDYNQNETLEKLFDEKK